MFRAFISHELKGHSKKKTDKLKATSAVACIYRERNRTKDGINMMQQLSIIQKTIPASLLFRLVKLFPSRDVELRLEAPSLSQT